MTEALLDDSPLDDSFAQDPIAIEVIRNGFLECVHRGRAVITGPDGSVEWSLGAVGAPFYPRSANKPMQALGMLRSGLDLDGELLALAAASHSGEDFHREGVLRILDGAGLGVEALQNTPDLPLDEDARAAWLRAGHDKEPLAMNCSGKHAAMLRTCVRAGWSTDSYREHDHPLQVGIRTALAECAGEDATHPGTDGCGAPLWAVSLIGLARAFAGFAAATDGPRRTIADAYRAHPEYASGTRRDEAALHRAVPGLVCKGGAEACLGVGLPDGRGLAVKVDDGNPRGVMAWTARLLQTLGYAGLDALTSVPVLGHGEPVGAIRVRHDALPR